MEWLYFVPIYLSHCYANLLSHSYCTRILKDSGACVFSPLEALSSSRRLGHDELMTAAFLQSGNVVTGSFFRVRPWENMLGQEPGRQTCSLQTALLSHKLREEEAWQLRDTNEARIKIDFKLIPFGHMLPHRNPFVMCQCPFIFSLYAHQSRLTTSSVKQSAMTQTSCQIERGMQGEVTEDYMR